jgi:hypothetical protein
MRLVLITDEFNNVTITESEGRIMKATLPNASHNCANLTVTSFVKTLLQHAFCAVFKAHTSATETSKLRPPIYQLYPAMQARRLEKTFLVIYLIKIYFTEPASDEKNFPVM